jgi:hypothetical protein
MKLIVEKYLLYVYKIVFPFNVHYVINSNVMPFFTIITKQKFNMMNKYVPTILYVFMQKAINQTMNVKMPTTHLMAKRIRIILCREDLKSAQ